MAVKKVNKQEEANVDVTMDTTPEIEETKAEDSVEVQTPQVEIEEPKNEPKVEVNESKVDTSKKPQGTVKIRMRVDHKCCIAMERYDLKANKTYVVPENVKTILNKAGLLAPL